MLDHPAIQATAAANNTISLTTPSWKLDALGIHAIYACDIVTRRVGGQTERYLGNSRRLAPIRDRRPTNPR